MVIDKIKKRIEVNDDGTERVHRSDIPVGKWVKCEKCKEILYKEDLHKNYSICPNCGAHFRLSSRRRIEQIIDEGTFEEFKLAIDTDNPLHMEDYIKNDSRLSENEKQNYQLSWVGLMNNYKSCAEEIVLQELIYN